ncbi:MAG: energy-coupling factor transporter ATPase [Clostridia bacterium]|nr:energy-coupling factor transporter ATPase [Clostridia bacterium]
MTAVKFTNVDFSYKGREDDEKKYVLKNFDFEIEQGAFVALIGANGSGKSTVAKLINGLLKCESGKIEVFGMDASDESLLYEIRKRVGMVFQNPDNQQIASIVEDDVAFGPENLGVEREEIGRRIDYALKATEMEKFRYSSVSGLSGGQKQRIAIAGVLAIRPEILILDESTSMLDPKGRKEVMDVVKTLNRENGITVVDITHYMDEAAEADKIFVLHGGKTELSGTPEDVFSDYETLSRCGLELPKAARLAKKLRDAGIPVMSGVKDEEELAENLCVSLRKI